MMTESMKKAQAKYEQKVVRITIKLIKGQDDDLIQILEAKDNKQGFIKDCIRKALDAPDHADQADRKLLQYHPMGWIDVNYGVPLFTEDGFDTLEDAIGQVNFWTQELMFDVVYAFVDIFCDGNYDPVERVDLKSVPHVDYRPTWKEGRHWVPKPID